MADKRHKDGNWTMPDVMTWEAATVAVLMDIRDELKGIRIAVENTDRTLRCPNFLDVPRVLREIRRNTTKRKKKKLTLVRSA